jgi:hypothetical protein
MTGKLKQTRNVTSIELLVNIITMIKLSKMRWAGHVTSIAENRNAHSFGKQTWKKRPLGRPRCRRDNVKIYLREL